MEKLALAMALAQRAWDHLDLVADDDGLETDLCTTTWAGLGTPEIKVGGLQVVTPKA